MFHIYCKVAELWDGTKNFVVFRFSKSALFDQFDFLTFNRTISWPKLFSFLIHAILYLY
jgi:hypothetical protein